MLMRAIVRTISPKWSWDYISPRPKVEENNILVSRSLRGNSFHYCPNKRAFNICFIYRFCFEREIEKLTPGSNHANRYIIVIMIHYMYGEQSIPQYSLLCHACFDEFQRFHKFNRNFYGLSFYFVDNCFYWVIKKSRFLNSYIIFDVLSIKNSYPLFNVLMVLEVAELCTLIDDERLHQGRVRPLQWFESKRLIFIVLYNDFIMQFFYNMF